MIIEAKAGLELVVVAAVIVSTGMALCVLVLCVLLGKELSSVPHKAGDSSEL